VTRRARIRILSRPADPESRCGACDCRNGHGSYVWPDGQRYAGAFRGGHRHGQGTFSWPDGRKYIGGWLRGEPSGLGTRIYADGSFLIGYFENGGYLGDSEHYGHRFAGPERQHPSTGVPPDEAGSGHPAPAAAAAEDSPGCEQQCNDLAELELNRITDEYECCYARHAFCVHKVQIEARSCDTQGCLDEQGLEVSERGTLYTK
jgi:hypothetical protein